MAKAEFPGRRMTNVVKLDLVEVGDGFRFEADDMLEQAKGHFSGRLLAIIGELEDGEIWINGTANAGETMILMERAKAQICGLKD